MAQDGFPFWDEGRSIPVLNDSGTTAIEAGDLLYSAANDDVIGGTAAQARGKFASGDIKVKSIICSDTGYQTHVGVANDDIAADGTGSMSTEGVWAHQAAENVEAGGVVQGMEGDGTTTVIANKVQVADEFAHKIGRALTGATADGKYLLWKQSL